MILTLNLKPETEAYAIKRAAELGITVDDYIEKLILEEPDEMQVFEEIFAPLRDGTETDFKNPHNK